MPRYRRDAVWLAAVLFAILVVAYAPFVFGGRSLMSSSRDVASLYDSGAKPPQTAEKYTQLRALDAGAPAWQTEPWLAIDHRIVADGRWPWWDPFDGYGQPFDAAMQPQPFYPLTALLALAPSPAAYTAWVLARLFLAGWFAALFLRLFADRVSALVAGAATMFTGYYLLYYDIPHLSVEIGLPMLLWATELLVRRPRAPERIAILAVAAGLTYLGGMPESAMLALITAGLYGIVRVAMMRERVRSGLALIAGHALGLTIGAICLIPFVEYVGASYNVHDPSKNVGTVMGLTFDLNWPQLVLSELVPRAFGHPWESILHGGVGHSGVRGFFGCTACVLAAIAVFAAIRRRTSTTAPVLFFFIVAAFFMLKRYGNPLVQWTGGLPILNLIEFAKYGEAIIGVCVALLAGFGVAAIRRRDASLPIVIGGFAVTLAALTWLTIAALLILPAYPLQHRFWEAIAPAIVALLVAGAATAILSAASGERWRASALCVLVFAIVAEPFVGYLRPTIWRAAPSIADNPYAGATYLAWLDAHVDRNRERIFSVGARPFPNWSGAYGFSDPRSINALYPDRYLPFTNAFLTGEHFVDRFDSVDPASMGTPLAERWLELSSVGWVTGGGRFPPIVDSPPEGIMAALWAGIEGQVAVPAGVVAPVRAQSILIDGIAENALSERAPYSVGYRAIVPRGRPYFMTDVAVDPRAYDHATCGGPMTLFLNVMASNGRSVGASTTVLNPLKKASDRHWRTISVDLRAARGQSVDLDFSTATVSGCPVVGVWGEPRFETSAERGRLPAQRPYRPAFADADTTIYRVPHPLPRVVLVHRVLRSDDFAKTLALLTAPDFDVHGEAVVEGADAALGPASPADTVAVVASHSDGMTADVVTKSAALLMQNDTWFPGWTARVDGQAAPLLRVDGLFRGVVVPGGRHAVEIRYRDRATQAGLVVSALGLVILIGLFAAGFSRARRRPAPTAS